MNIFSIEESETLSFNYIREKREKMQIEKFDEKFILKWLVVFNIILVSLYLLSNYLLEIPSWTIRHMFDLNAEYNIPTWFSSIQLFLLFLLAIACSAKTENEHLRNFYYLMAFSFLFFSVDEVAMIHEGLTNIFSKMSITTFFPNGHGIWIFIYPAVLFILLVIFSKGLLLFLREQNGRTMFIAGALVFFVGGVGFEIVGYLIFYLGGESVLLTLSIIFEESFELLGQSLMIYALLLKLNFQPVNLRLRSS